MRINGGIGPSFDVQPFGGQGANPQLGLLHDMFQTGTVQDASVQGLQTNLLQQVLQNVLSNQDSYSLSPNDQAAIQGAAGAGQPGSQQQPPMEVLMQLIGMLAQQNPALAMELLRAMMGGQGGATAGTGGGGLASLGGAGAAPVGSGVGGAGSLAALGGGVGSPAGNQRLQSLSNDLAARSPLFAQLNSLYPGSVTAQNLPDPAGADLRGLYNPNTNAVILDTDNLGGNPLEVQRTLAEEVAHRAISQSTLSDNPGAQVATQANEVIAKTYANLVVAEAQGIPLTSEVMDQAINQAMADVARNYGGVPRGNYRAMLDSFLSETQLANEPLLRQKLVGAFQANGFAA